ncbi:MAG: hypothetical protein IPK82_20135 [Polyangiaceae bacterium]|nr:hypothetical protein [Polyangiaceae bacterium]
MDFTAGRRETICDVCAGDLVTVQMQHRDGKLSPDDRGRLPYLIYKPFFAGEDISARRRDHLHGTGSSTPEWEVDVGSIWTPLGGSLAIAGGAGNARFRVFHTLQHCRPDPGFELTLSFMRASGEIARPRGAQYARVGNASIVRLSSAEHAVNVPMQPNGQRYPLGFAQTIQPLSLTSLYFGIVV